MLTASVLLAILFSVATAQPHGYTSMGELISDDSSMHGDRRELGWQRFYSRTHSHEEEYDTTRAWPGGGPGMYRAESQPGTPGIMNALVEADGVTPVTYEMPGLRGAWSGGDVRLDRTDDKWPEQVRQNCTDPTATGIETLPSGLQYKVLTQGSGTEYPRDDTPCDIHYTARKGVSGAVGACAPRSTRDQQTKAHKQNTRCPPPCAQPRMIPEDAHIDSSVPPHAPPPTPPCSLPCSGL